MATISRIAHLVNGIVRGLDLYSNSLAMYSLILTTDSGITPITLTAANLGTLTAQPSLADASLLHIHNDIYYTELELGNTTQNSTGATLIGDRDADYTNFSPSGNNVKATLMAINTAIGALQSIQIEWLDSVLDRFNPTSALPSNPQTGDRYLSTATANGWTINKIYEYSGSAWVETTPTTGTYVSVDDEPTVLYYYGGSSWTAKYFEATTVAQYGALTLSTATLSVNVDNSTIEIYNTSNHLRVKDAGITEAKLNLAAAGGAGSGFIDAETFIVGGTWSPASGTISETDTIHSALEKLQYQITNISISSTSTVSEIMVAGEAFSQKTLYAVRLAKPSGETAGTVYKADPTDVDTTPTGTLTPEGYHVIGVVFETADRSVGDNITVYKLGKLTTSINIAIGPLYLAKFSGGATNVQHVNSYADAANEACVLIGYSRNATTSVIEVKPQIMYVY